jgi:RNA polymerase sigma-70 factor (ECF subfamily)
MNGVSETARWGLTLAAEAQGSDDSQVTALVGRHATFLYRLALACLRNHHDAEDVVQETFLRVYRSRAWKVMENERAFLGATAWRIAVDRRRRATRLAAPGREPASAAAGPERETIAHDSHVAVHRIIDALPEELRQTLALSAIEELNSREIAALMNVPEGTVRSRLQRARLLVKEKLERKEVRSEFRRT